MDATSLVAAAAGLMKQAQPSAAAPHWSDRVPAMQGPNLQSARPSFGSTTPAMQGPNLQPAQSAFAGVTAGGQVPRQPAGAMPSLQGPNLQPAQSASGSATPAMQGPNLQPAQSAFGSTTPAMQGPNLQPAGPSFGSATPAMQGPNLQPAQSAFGSTTPAMQGPNLQPAQPSATPAAGPRTRDFMAGVSPKLQEAYPSQLATWEKAKRQEAARLEAAQPTGEGGASAGQQAVRDVYDMPPGAQAAPATGPFSQAGIPHVRNIPAYLERLRSEGAAAGGGKTDRWQAAAEKNRAAGNESTARYFEDMIAREQARGQGEAAPAYQSSIAQQAKAQGWGKYQPQPKIPQISAPTATNPLGPLSPQPGVRGGGAALALTGGRPIPGQPGGPLSMYKSSQQIAAARGLGVPYAPDLGGRSAPMGGRISTVKTPVPTAG